MLLQGRGAAWTVVEVTLDDFPGGAQPYAAAMLAWFIRRAGSVRHLHLAGIGPRLPASLLAAVLMSQVAHQNPPITYNHSQWLGLDRPLIIFFHSPISVRYS